MFEVSALIQKVSCHYIIVAQLGFFIVNVRMVHLIHILRDPRETMCSVNKLHLFQKTADLERRGNIK